MTERRDPGVGDTDPRLTELARHVDYPTMTGTAGAVGRQLHEEEAAGRFGRRRGWFASWREGLPGRWHAPWQAIRVPAWRRVAVATVGVAVGILLVSPAALSAVAGLLGLGGVEIHQVEQLPPVGDRANVRGQLGRRGPL